MGDVLGLFAKCPRPGRVKTRLAAATSPEFAAAVADAFLRDSLDRLSAIAARHIVAFDPPEEESFFTTIAGSHWQLMPQHGTDLGERLADFFARQFAGGAVRVVVLGMDSPTLPLDHVTRALESLRTNDIVLGPATDGGYYLIGGTPRLPPLFTGIRWSQSDVQAQTVQRIPPESTFALLPPWYDVDTLDDWRMLRGHLAALRRAGIDPLAPRTELLATGADF